MSEDRDGLLRKVELEFSEEFDMDDGAMTTGEVTLSLDFAEGVEFDVDGEDGDGEIIIQYWQDHE